MKNPLSSTCHCGRRVRVLWTGPIGPDSRPALLVCGHHPDRRCDFEQVVDPDDTTPA